MKTDKRKKKGAKKKLRLHTLWAKPHRFSAHVTEEQDWQTEVPNVRLARVFGIVLILHVVAVGGILAFKMIEKNSTAPEEASTLPAGAEESGESEEPAATTAAVDQSGVNVIVDDPSRLGMKHYRVRSGDNLLAVARRLGVSVSELEELNKLNKGNELYAGQVLLVPNRKISALPPEDIQKLLGEPIPDKVIKAETSAAMADVVARVETVVEKAQSSLPVGGVVRKAVPLSGGTVNAPVLKPVPAQAPAAAPVVATPRIVAPAPPVIGSTANTKSYVVQPGDTPYGIARRFGVDFKHLMSVNGIDDPTVLKVGAELRIP